MKLKDFRIHILVLTSVVLFTLSCKDDVQIKGLEVTAVKTLYEPTDNRALVLQSSASAILYFEWEPSYSGDGGQALYEIAFDKADGDFSQPLTVIASDNNGGSNHATVTHKQLNKIAAQAGIGSGEQGTIKWTVFSSKGISQVKAAQERNLTVTRLQGFADIPEELYITGEATEAGSDITKAIKMKKVSEGEFEVYTKLTQGKTFKFVDTKTGTISEFSVSDDKLVLNGTSSVTKTGVYKYYIDFTIGSFKTKEVTKVYLFLNWSQQKIELPYKEFGVWELNNHTITGLAGSDNNDDRYKFRMESDEGETEWRAVSNDSKPTGNDAYYYMVEKSNVQQWTDNEIWKNPSTTGWSDKTYDFSFSLNSENPYTHNLIIK
ncbi:MAG: hypothetical protein BGO29_15270 [Bacteroidales bacterium 36-12]|nr:MAG: hypothetical protein BGO29_15270 [Bacteroidales bacterium 36-12]